MQRTREAQSESGDCEPADHIPNDVERPGKHALDARASNVKIGQQGFSGIHCDRETMRESREDVRQKDAHRASAKSDRRSAKRFPIANAVIENCVEAKRKAGRVTDQQPDAQTVRDLLNRHGAFGPIDAELGKARVGFFGQFAPPLA